MWSLLFALGCSRSADTASSDEAVDTAAEAALSGVELVDEDATFFHALGYSFLTYQLTDGSYLGQSGDPPTWIVLRPTVAPDDVRDVLMWFHGGSYADDVDENLSFPCDLQAGLDLVEAAILGAYVPRLAAERDWAVVYPINDWCDGFTGLGDEDPVEPGEHYGRHHVERVMAWLDAGGGGFTPDRYVGWGASAGALTALHVAGNSGRFSALVTDSGPTSTLRYHELVSRLAMEHLFGGPPDEAEAEARYLAHDGEEVVRSGRFDGPLALPWNAQDLVTDVVFPEGLIGALEERGGDFVVHDYNHPAPGEIFHTQARYFELPWAYGTLAWMDFLDGWQLAWEEAEGLACDGCDVGAPCEGGDAEQLSGASGRCASSSESGVLAVAEVPAELSAGGRVMLVLRAFELDGLADDAPVLAVTVGGERTELLAGVLATAANEVDQVDRQLAHTVIELPPGTEGELVLEIDGGAGVMLDAFIWQWSRAAQ